MLERYDHAVRRGADIYGEVLGTAAASDGRDRSGGTGLVNAMRAALKKGGIGSAGGIGHINAHGKSTRWDDLVESRAYRTLLGDDLAGVPGDGPEEPLRPHRRRQRGDRTGPAACWPCGTGGCR